MSLPIPTKPPTRTRKPLPRPIFLDNEDQDVDNHPLHCSICFDVSFNPVITPCQHIFCRDCIESVLRRSMSCPNDRRVLNRHSLQNISGLHEYIYNRTLVQCQNCKNWEGQFQQYKVHTPTCYSSSHIQTLDPKIEALKLRHKQELKNLQASISDMKAALGQERQLNQNREVEKEHLQNQIDTLKDTVSALEYRIASMGPTLHLNYQYDGRSVSDLSRIMNRYVHEKPTRIDTNSFFNSIRRCYGVIRDVESTDLKFSLKMLLVSSLETNWFTTEQVSRLKE